MTGKPHDDAAHDAFMRDVRDNRISRGAARHRAKVMQAKRRERLARELRLVALLRLLLPFSREQRVIPRDIEAKIEAELAMIDDPPLPEHEPVYTYSVGNLDGLPADQPDPSKRGFTPR